MARSFVGFSQHIRRLQKHQRPKYWILLTEYEADADLAVYRRLHNTYESLEYIKRKQMRSRFGFYRFSYIRSVGSVGSLARSCRKLHTKRTYKQREHIHTFKSLLSRRKSRKKVLNAASCCWLVDTHTREFHVPSPVEPFNMRWIFLFFLVFRRLLSKP